LRKKLPAVAWETTAGFVGEKEGTSLPSDRGILTVTIDYTQAFLMSSSKIENRG